MQCLVKGIILAIAEVFMCMRMRPINWFSTVKSSFLYVIVLLARQIYRMDIMNDILRIGIWMNDRENIILFDIYIETIVSNNNNKWHNKNYSLEVKSWIYTWTHVNTKHRLK